MHYQSTDKVAGVASCVLANGQRPDRAGKAMQGVEWRKVQVEQGGDREKGRSDLGEDRFNSVQQVDPLGMQGPFGHENYPAGYSRGCTGAAAWGIMVNWITKLCHFMNYDFDGQSLTVLVCCIFLHLSCFHAKA